MCGGGRGPGRGRARGFVWDVGEGGERGRGEHLDAQKRAELLPAEVGVEREAGAARRARIERCAGAHPGEHERASGLVLGLHKPQRKERYDNGFHKGTTRKRPMTNKIIETLPTQGEGACR